jgi:hypothetical protein
MSVLLGVREKRPSDVYSRMIVSSVKSANEAKIYDPNSVNFN